MNNDQWILSQLYYQTISIILRKNLSGKRSKQLYGSDLEKYQLSAVDTSQHQIALFGIN